MKKFAFWVLALVIIGSSCTSTEKMVSLGQYDRAINKSVKKLSKKKKEKFARSLDKAYRLANERDQNRIEQLMREGNEENWERIMQTYQQLNYRQEKIKRVSPVILDGREMYYKFVNYNEKIADAKSNAAAFYYNDGLSLMDVNTKEAYRNAYFNFQKVDKYGGSKYPDTKQLLTKCLELGTSYAIIQGYNETGFRIPPQYLQNAVAVSPNAINHNWLKVFYENYERGAVFDYEVNLVINEILVSENGIDNEDHLFKKEVEAGFDYVLDDNGNVMKDSLGNDIKLIRYKDISCTVIETRQFKSAKVIAVAEIINVPTKKVVASHPLTAETKFDYFSARAVGDIEALPKEWVEKCKLKRVPFPHDTDLVMETSTNLNHHFQAFLRNNKNLLY